MKKVLLFFAVMMMAMQVSALDLVFDTNDTWSEKNSTKSISCTKDGITLTIVGSRFTPTVKKSRNIDFGPEGTATITVNAGTATVTGITVANSRENFDLTGAGPWTCPIEAGGLKNGSSSLLQLNSFTVHIGAAHTHNYATTWSTDANNHWHACTGTGTCDAPKKDVAAHSYGNVVTETAYYTCSVCQYENATRKAEHDAYLVMDANTDANTAKIFAKLGTVANVTINNLTIKGGKWSTICLPFSLSSSEIETAFGAGAEVAKLASSSYDAANEALSLNFTSVTEMEAGDPYVIKVTADVANPTFADVTLATYECQTATTDYASMKGDFDKHFLNGGDKNTWFISNNTFYYPSEDGFLAATKCWFNLLGEAQQSSTSAKAKSIRMNIFGSEATAIHSVTPATKVSGNEVYNLQGVRVSNPTKKGIYIRNGVKMVVK